MSAYYILDSFGRVVQVRRHYSNRFVIECWKTKTLLQVSQQDWNKIPSGHTRMQIPN